MATTADLFFNLTAEHHIIPQTPVAPFFQNLFNTLKVSGAETITLYRTEGAAVFAGQAAHTGGHLGEYYSEVSNALSRIQDYVLSYTNTEGVVASEALYNAKNAYGALRVCPKSCCFLT